MELTDAMQGQARALADPSRFRMFRFIVDASEPVGVAELTELLGFNHNAIRQHLALLLDAGLIVEFDENRQTRGRPRKLYRHRADALAAFRSISGSYERLAHLLLELHGSGDTPFEVGRRAAVEGGAGELRDPITEIVRLLALEGFEPTVLDETTVRLDHCPFADVASKNPGVVCELHRGLLAGAAERAGGATSMAVALTPKPPVRAGCIVAMTVDARGHGGTNG